MLNFGFGRSSNVDAYMLMTFPEAGSVLLPARTVFVIKRSDGTTHVHAENKWLFPIPSTVHLAVELRERWAIFFVNGQVVVDSGKHTGMLAGRALRRGRAST